MAPKAQPGAMIPGSTSLARIEDPDLGLSPVSGSDYLRLSWSGGGAVNDWEIIGRLDKPTGRFSRSIAMKGCTTNDIAYRSGRSSADGHDHLWATIWDGHGTGGFLADFDATTGRVPWAARCDGCDSLTNGGTEVLVVAVIDSPFRPDYTGRTDVIAIDPPSHSIRGPVRLSGALVPSDAGMWVVDEDSSLHRVDAVSGKPLASFPGAGPVPRDKGLAQNIVVMNGSVWTAETGQLVARDSSTMNMTGAIAIKGCWKSAAGPKGMWCLTAAGESLVDIVEVGPTGKQEYRTTVSTYQAFVNHAGVVTHVPDIYPDETGYWYIERIPTPTRRDLSTDGSGGPYFLLHVST